jgi:putative membrane protein
MRRVLTTFLWNLLLNIGALAAVVWLLRDVSFAPFVDTSSAKLRALVIAGLVIGVLNVLVKPVLRFLSMPLIVLSMGIFLLILNGFIFYLTVQLMHGGEIVVSSSWAYIAGGLVFAIVNTLERVFLGPRRARHHHHDEEQPE